MTTIFRKTAKGIEEVQTRAHRLSPRARSALILVDGQRSDDDLAKLITVQAAETLQTLLDGGFIEATATVVAAPATPVAPSPAPLARPAMNFELVRREAVRRLLEQIGPTLGEPLAMRMERTKDIEALRPILITARGVIANLRGERAAADYIAALSAL